MTPLYGPTGKALNAREQELFGCRPVKERAPSGRVVVGMLALNEEEYLEAALESVHADVDKIVLVVGGTELARDVGMCGEDGAPTDSTMGVIEALKNRRDSLAAKVKIVGPRLWPSKMEMRNAVLEAAAEGDTIVVQDADEVFFKGALKAALALLQELPEGAAISPPRLDFWNDFKTLGAGPEWENCVESRIFRNTRDRAYVNHCSLNYVGPFVRLPFALWTHYAYVKPLPKLRKKVDYYRNHPRALRLGSRVSESYIEDVFLRWREDPRAIEAEQGTHVFGGGTTRPYEGFHPEPIRRRMGAGELPEWRWEMGK